VAALTAGRPEFGGGLLPVVVQDVADGAVLMLAWANAEALDATERTGEAHFWSRSRNELWRKGATSGNVLPVVRIATDCDRDALLYVVRPAGPACHTGARSCFEADAATAGAASPEARFTLASLAGVIAERRSADPEVSYTARLLAAGPRRAAEKVIEEAGELVTASLSGSDDEVRHEAADLLYHALVLLASRGIDLSEVEATLAARR
jgi:phosphoribosyl-ATP pyrophosphohydrolase/phosphoribosyl-AMP cyclohydrolase